jgi:hypothetical protein
MRTALAASSHDSCDVKVVPVSGSVMFPSSVRWAATVRRMMAATFVSANKAGRKCAVKHEFGMLFTHGEVNTQIGAPKQQRQARASTRTRK